MLADPLTDEEIEQLYSEGDVRETKPKMFENPDNIERCPVTAFLYYQEHRPAQMLNDDSPFYIPAWP
jgi:hypothetical protein